MTEMLRRHWGLNNLLPDHDKGTAKAKNRTDHRHHAIDAAVIAATDRSLVKQISDAAGCDAGDGHSADRTARNTPPPWEGFRSDIGKRLNRIIVSHRADHGRIDITAKKKGHDSTTGQLHNETAYGIVDTKTVASRTPLLSLKSKDIEVKTGRKNIRDPQLQKLLSEVIKGKEEKEMGAALAEFSVSARLNDGKPNPYLGIRRVRMTQSLQSSSRIKIRGGDNKPYKAYKGDSNHCFEVWRMPDGNLEPWVITTFDAHRETVSRPHPAAKRLLRIYKRDMVAIERDGERLICYVQKFDSAEMNLAPHTESNADARHRDKSDDFKLIRMSARTVMKAGLRRVFVDELGGLRDTGALF